MGHDAPLPTWSVTAPRDQPAAPPASRGLSDRRGGAGLPPTTARCCYRRARDVAANVPVTGDRGAAGPARPTPRTPPARTVTANTSDTTSPDGDAGRAAAAAIWRSLPPGSATWGNAGRPCA